MQKHKHSPLFCRVHHSGLLFLHLEKEHISTCNTWKRNMFLLVTQGYCTHLDVLDLKLWFTVVLFTFDFLKSTVLFLKSETVLFMSLHKINHSPSHKVQAQQILDWFTDKLLHFSGILWALPSSVCWPPAQAGCLQSIEMTPCSSWLHGSPSTVWRIRWFLFPQPPS